MSVIDLNIFRCSSRRLSRKQGRGDTGQGLTVRDWCTEGKLGPGGLGGHGRNAEWG